MIVPVIFSLAPICEELLYTWSFYKGVDMVKHYGWPLFAQRQYFEEKEKQRRKGFYSETVAKHNDMDVYSPADDIRYVHVVFPENLIQDYVSRFPSQTDAYMASLNTPWPEMTQFMVDTIKELECTGHEKTEAFMCLCDTQFIRDAAKQLNIDILHYEWAPFRGPAYRNTAYLDLKGNMCDGEMLDRYEAFQKVAHNLPIFNRREILAFFLNDENLHYAYEEDIEPEFEAGLGFGYNVPWIFNHFSQMTSAEMYTKAEKLFGDEHIAVRYHPSDPVHADLRRGVPDKGSLIEFIRKSRRILCNTSALAYEAMLFNRPAYEMGQSQYKYFTNRDLKGLPDHIADDSFLSFIAFGYCIPFELLKSVQYLRWRLSHPGEQDIYLYHLHYYMDCLGITGAALELSPEVRLEAILQARKPGLDEVLVDIDSGKFASDEQARLYATIERYRLKIKLLENNQQKTMNDQKETINDQKETINQLTNELNCVLNSKSWRITRPLRKITEALRKMKR